MINGNTTFSASTGVHLEAIIKTSDLYAERKLLSRTIQLGELDSVKWQALFVQRVKTQKAAMQNRYDLLSS